MPTSDRTFAARAFHAVVLIVGLLLIGGVADPPAAQGALDWEALGPWEGYVTALAMDPVNPSRIYAGISARGVFKSTDGGSNWESVNSGLPISSGGYREITAIVPDPVSSGTVFAGTDGGGVFKSTDGGASWAAINSGLGYPYREYIRVTALVADPINPTTFYAGIASGGIFKTTNGGASWTLVGLDWPWSDEFHAVVVVPSTPRVVFVGTANHGIYKGVETEEGLTEWVEVNAGLVDGASQYVTSLALDPSSRTTIYAGTLGGVFKSQDGGANWISASSGIMNPSNASLAIDPQTPDTVYAGTFDGKVYKSTDGGTIWIVVNTPPVTVFSRPVLLVDPSAPATLYWGYDSGVLKSTDGGNKWRATSKGLPPLQVAMLVIDPADSNILYIGSSVGTIYKSIDAGASWTRIPDVSGVRALLIDPRSSSILYAATGSRGVLRSENGGSTWTAINSGMPTLDVYTLAIDPAASRTLYAGTYGGGILKSIDAGMSWIGKNTGLANLHILKIVIDPRASSVLYAQTDSGQVYRSTDGGAGWLEADAGLPAAGTHTLLHHPTMSGRLFARRGDYIYRTMNSGASWDTVTTALLGPDPEPNCTALGWNSKEGFTLDPANPSIFYASDSNDIAKSTDGGVHWIAPAPPVFTAHCMGIGPVTIDPKNSSVLYVGAVNGLMRLRQPALHPQLFMDVNQGRLLPGDTHTLRVTLLPGEVSADANVYLALQLSDGSLLYLLGDGGLSAEGRPIASVVPISEYSGQPFAYTFTDSEPAGTYRWLGAYADPITGVLEGGIFESPAFSFTPSTMLPRVSLTPNKAFLRPGDRHALMVGVSPGTNPMEADIYIALQLPDGSLRFLREDGSLGDIATPRAIGWSGESGSFQAFNHIFTGDEPAGTYKWLAAFAEPGTLNFVGPIVSAPFSFAP